MVRIYETGQTTDKDGSVSNGASSADNPASRLQDLLQANSKRGQPVSRILLDQGTLPARDMVFALAETAQLGAPLPLVLEAEALVSQDDILDAQSAHWGTLRLRRTGSPPDPELSDLLSPEFCLSNGILPWMKLGSTLVIATSRPEQFQALLPHFPGDFGPLLMAVCSEQDIHDEIGARHGTYLSNRAEQDAPLSTSCRDIGLGTDRTRHLALAFGTLALMVLVLFPNIFFGLSAFVAVVSMTAIQGLRIAGWLANRNTKEPVLPDVPIAALPNITLLVPLFKEAQIADTLVRRLTRLDYPRARLEVILILEEIDTETRSLIQKTDLPNWMKVLEVPIGKITTKPRALNYALRFARGEIIGIYDAEDAPATDQLRKVAAQFAASPASTACLQGILDFYNPKSNWLARCFTIEYASWFRIVLPGLTKLGLAIPLGGTTVFLRRAALQAVGGWDAHNVTEDAELGIRLARMGYKTEMLHSVTREEANIKPWPWVKQRSRWLKGYALTWWCHTRNPRKLAQDLGIWRFWGFQIIFLASLIQFLLAPVLWSFWSLLLGPDHPLSHPLSNVVSGQGLQTIIGILIASQVASLILFTSGIARSQHKGLLIFVPTMFVYFPLGCVAFYKALLEIVRAPFFWDKTQHGVSEPDSYFGAPPDK